MNGRSYEFIRTTMTPPIRQIGAVAESVRKAHGPCPLTPTRHQAQVLRDRHRRTAAENGRIIWNGATCRGFGTNWRIVESIRNLS